MNKSRLALVIILNTLIVASEIIFGVLGNSMALVADALHNLGDILAIVISLIAIIYSEKRATREMTYGYVRSEMMAGFVNALFLILTMGYILYESIIRLIKPGEVNGVAMMAVAGIALAANGLSAYLLRDFGHHHGHDHHEHACAEDEHSHSDQNIKATYLHLLSDAGISLGVVAGGVVVYFFKLYFIDSAFSIVFSILIIWESWKIFRATFLSLMDAAPANLKNIEKTILAHSEIKSIHDIHITSPSSKEVFFSAHIVLKDEMNLGRIEQLLEELRCELKEYGVTHPLFQPETGRYDHEDTLCQSHCN